MNDLLDFFRNILPSENIFEIKIDNMDTRFEDLTKEQLIAELNVATEKLKYYRTIEDHARAGIQLSPQELSARLAISEANLAAIKQELVLVYEKNKHLCDRVDQFEEQEKKREFERRLAEATDFLKANGYEVINMNEQGRQQIQPESPNSLKWTDSDMLNFATIVFFRSPNEASKLLEDYAFRRNG